MRSSDHGMEDGVSLWRMRRPPGCGDLRRASGQAIRVCEQCQPVLQLEVGRRDESEVRASENSRGPPWD